MQNWDSTWLYMKKSPKKVHIVFLDDLKENQMKFGEISNLFKFRTLGKRNIQTKNSKVPDQFLNRVPSLLVKNYAIFWLWNINKI